MEIFHYRKMMKVFDIEAEGASKEELEAIRIAIEEMAVEIFRINNENGSDHDSKEWKFSGRWWLEDNNAIHPTATWG
tara:strand:+ start:3724 stop:3954 length:231 start_codon:yes stop_codon:yes gene_type:complete